jgi:predicted acetyltransferase
VILNTDLLGLYERFGFGVATTAWSATISSPGPFVADSTVQLVESAVAARLLPGIFAAAQHHRPGEVVRTPSWWEEHVADTARARLPTEFAILEVSGARAGYVAFVRPQQSSGQALVAELIVTSDEHVPALVEFLHGAVGSEQLFFRSQPRQVIDVLGSAATDLASSPQLWLRILDVAKALSLRRYGASLRAVFSIGDELLESNRGRFLLEVGADGTGVVTKTSEEAAVTLGVGALARLFLGGTTFRDLAARGELAVSDDALLEALDRAFAPVRAPFCSTLL